jgi:ATP-dependent RNA helicase RhlE
LRKREYLADIEKLTHIRIPSVEHEWPMQVFEKEEKQTQGAASARRVPSARLRAAGRTGAAAGPLRGKSRSGPPPGRKKVRNFKWNRRIRHSARSRTARPRPKVQSAAVGAAAAAIRAAGRAGPRPARRRRKKESAPQAQLQQPQKRNRQTARRAARTDAAEKSRARAPR